MSASKVLLIGDWIEDVSKFGKVTRLCPEAPVPIWVPEGRELRTAGGMGLVEANLAALGAEVFSYRLSKSRKTRFWSGKHLIMRQDEDTVQRTTLDKSLLPRLNEYDAVVVSDYRKGGVTDDDAKVVSFYAKKLNVKLFVDTKNPRPGLFGGAYAIFPNESEAPHVRPADFQHVIHKLGSKGCCVDGTHVPTRPVEEYDVTGAGDVFLAAFVVSDLNGTPLLKSAEAANHCAAVSVKHQGGYVIKLEDLDE